MASKASNLSSVASNPRRDESEESGSKRKLPSQKSKEGKDDLAAELRELGWSDVDIHDADKKSAKLSLEGELSNLLGETTQKSSQGRRKGGFDKSQITAHKKKALLLKREGKIAEAKDELKKAKILEKQLEEQELLGEDEAEEELKKGKVLEQQLEEMENATKGPVAEVGKKVLGSTHAYEGASMTLDLVEEGPDAEVTEHDMHDPALLSVLKNLGWNDDDGESVSMTNKPTKQMTDESTHDHVPSVISRKAMRSKAEVQKDLLSLKRKALALRRQGKTEEAEEVLEKAKALENEKEEMETSHSAKSMLVWNHMDIWKHKRKQIIRKLVVLYKILMRTCCQL